MLSSKAIVAAATALLCASSSLAVVVCGTPNTARTNLTLLWKQPGQDYVGTAGLGFNKYAILAEKNPPDDFVWVPCTTDDFPQSSITVPLLATTNFAKLVQVRPNIDLTKEITAASQAYCVTDSGGQLTRAPCSFDDITDTQVRQFFASNVNTQIYKRVDRTFQASVYGSGGYNISRANDGTVSIGYTDDGICSLCGLTNQPEDYYDY